MFYLDEEPPNDEKLKSGVAVSFGLHALVISLFTLKAVFFPSESIDYTAAVRVDIVGLPDKNPPANLPPAEAKAEAAPHQPEPTPPAPEPEPVKEEPKVEKVVETTKAEKLPPKPAEKEAIKLDKNKNKQAEALRKLKAMAALEKLEDEVAKEQKPPAKGQSPSGSYQVKGNVLSPGTALTGLNKLQHDSYIGELDRHIKQQWALPELLAKKDYKAQVLVRIDENGQLVAKQLIKSSGNPSYDDEVLATIDKSIPFPKPPEKFTSILRVGGFIVGFPE